MLAASDLEFKLRFWIIGAIFWLSFFAYNLDHQNSGVALVDWLARLRGTAPSDGVYHLVFAFAAFLCLLAALLRTWATAYLKPEVMVDGRVHTNRLVADGPYRYVRNPLYFGNILLALGFAFMASRIGFVILVVGNLIFMYRLIFREEAGLLAEQGESYSAYLAAVPRLFPSLHARLPAAGGTPNWTDGLLGEAFMWVMAGSVVAFAITLQIKIFFWFLGSAFVVYAICYAVIRSRRRSADLPQAATVEDAGKPTDTRD